MGYSRGEALRLGRQYVQEDYKRAKSMGDTWTPVGIVVMVYRQGVELAEESCWGFESDDKKYLAHEAADLADTALAEAKTKLAALTAPDTDDDNEEN